MKVRQYRAQWRRCRSNRAGQSLRILAKFELSQIKMYLNSGRSIGWFSEETLRKVMEYRIALKRHSVDPWKHKHPEFLGLKLPPGEPASYLSPLSFL